ncbi:unnamed protein product [Urochloa humidicola]
MASSSSGTAKHLRVLLSFSCDTLRIPDVLAGEIGAEEALIVSPAGGKVKFWAVEVGKDGGGAFLGRGWPEFAEACGAGAGWSLVLRHRGRGVLSAKAFDATCCLRELGAPAPPAVEETSSKGSTHKPQFIRALPKDFMEKMLIPAGFVQQYIPTELLDSREAIVLGPSGKVFRIKLEMGWSGVFLAGGWPQFLKFHDITEANALLLRHEGSMVFTLKVYESNRYQGGSKHKEKRGRQISTLPSIEEQQEAPSASTQKQQEAIPASIQKQQRTPSASIQKQQEAVPASIQRQQRTPSACFQEQQEAPPASIQKQYVNDLPSSNGEKEPQGPTPPACFQEQQEAPPASIQKQYVNDLPSSNGEKDPQGPTPPASIQKQYVNDLPSSNGEKEPQGPTASLDQTSSKIRPPSSIEKQISADALKNHIVLPKAFCDSIGLRESCAITLKTSRNSNKSWLVHSLPGKNGSYQLGKGWRRFCQENSLKEGDNCTFNVTQSTMWHVIINRLQTITDDQEQHETPFAPTSRKRKSRDDSLSSDENKKKGPMTLKNASRADGVYEIGPPAWLKKKISTRTIKNSLPAAFCDGIGLREACMVTLKTSLSSTSFWQVRVLPYKNTSHQVGSGWKTFCQENKIKEGDVCTFKVIEIRLWLVVIERS